MNLELLIFITSFIGTVAFAISGSLIAIECKLDIFGVIVLGTITACCGGIIRDVMLSTEISAFTEPIYLIISVITSTLLFIILYYLKTFDFTTTKLYKNIFVITDSIGLGAFVVVGANKAIALNHQTMLEICFYGVMTAVGGGLIRDIMVNKIPAILRKHIYAVAAIIGSIFFYLMYINKVNIIINFSITVIIIVLIRYLAYYFELGLPKIKFKDIGD